MNRNSRRSFLNSTGACAGVLGLPALSTAIQNASSPYKASQAEDVLMMHQGRDEEAEKNFRLALAERELAGQQDSPEAFTELWNLGGLYMENRRIADAVSLFQRCLPVRAGLHAHRFTAGLPLRRHLGAGKGTRHGRRKQG